MMKISHQIIIRGLPPIQELILHLTLIVTKTLPLMKKMKMKIRKVMKI
jgi:hypothetical protein